MLGKVLRLIREQNDVSLTQAAIELGMSKAYVSELENDKKVPTLETLERYSKTFEIPVSHILFFSENYDSNEGRLAKNVRQLLGRAVVRALRG